MILTGNTCSYDVFMRLLKRHWYDKNIFKEKKWYQCRFNKCFCTRCMVIVIVVNSFIACCTLHGVVEDLLQTSPFSRNVSYVLVMNTWWYERCHYIYPSWKGFNRGIYPAIAMESALTLCRFSHMFMNTLFTQVM